jgi:hypothetical protein
MQVFWPPGSGSVPGNYLCGSGSGSESFKNLEKLWFPLVIFKDLYVNEPTVSNKQKKLKIYCLHLESYLEKRAGSVIQWTNPRIRIRTKTSRIRGTVFYKDQLSTKINTDPGYGFAKNYTDLAQLGCPRKCFFYFRRNTEFFEKHTEFRGIFTVKFARNSAEFRMYFHTEFRR